MLDRDPSVVVILISPALGFVLFLPEAGRLARKVRLRWGAVTRGRFSPFDCSSEHGKGSVALSCRSEYNIGELSRARFADSAFLVGFGSDHGTVAAASDWDGPMEFKQIRPSHEASYERLCHDSHVDAFMREAPHTGEFRVFLKNAESRRLLGGAGGIRTDRRLCSRSGAKV